MDPLSKIFASGEVSHQTPRLENGTFSLREHGVDVFFQASNTDSNFQHLGPVNALKVKHRPLWNFSSGMS